MANAVDKVVNQLKISADMTDLLLAGVTKYYSEQVLSGYIGNATYFSGAVKLAGGLVLDKFVSGKIGKIGKMALVLDGVEDVVANAMRQFVGSGNSNANANIL